MSVFGDSAAKSDSIAKAIDHLREVDTLTMRYSAAMLASLKSIEANIGGLTNLIIRTNGMEASAAGIQTGTKLTGLLGTANSMHIVCEALGMALPGSARRMSLASMLTFKVRSITGSSCSERPPWPLATGY